MMSEQIINSLTGIFRQRLIDEPEMCEMKANNMTICIDESMEMELLSFQVVIEFGSEEEDIENYKYPVWAASVESNIKGVHIGQVVDGIRNELRGLFYE